MSGRAGSLWACSCKDQSHHFCFKKQAFVKEISFLIFSFSLMALSIQRESNKEHQMDGKYVRYTPEQVEVLERIYVECPKPTSTRRQQLIREHPLLANIEPKQIKVWFQNRRYICLWRLSTLLYRMSFDGPFVSDFLVRKMGFCFVCSWI